jgi:SET domain-containing protein
MPSRLQPPFVSPVRVRRSRIQGRGVFATRDIPQGERIIEYVGTRISSKQADEQNPDDDASRRHHTFLFAVDDEVVVDASRGGNDARLINHSCDPNCEVVIERRRIFIHALRPISAGKELSYDYWYVTDSSYTLEDLRRIYPCRCGAASCRGTLARPPKPAKRRSSAR